MQPQSILRRARLKAAGAATAVAALASVAMAAPPPAVTPTANAPVQATDAQIVHAMNRLAFGPRPGDIAKVKQIGLTQWINQQLHPENIDDTAVDTKIAQLKGLQMPGQQLMLAYITDTKKVQKAFLAAKNKNGNDQNAAGAAMMAADVGDTMAPGTSVEVIGELEAGKLYRAIDSNRQLQEELVDFWSNHFNEDVKKNVVRTLKIADDRDVIRPHVFGRFRDMLEASAKSPAMLIYLDNALSTRDYDPNAKRQRQNRRGRNRPFFLQGNAPVAGVQTAPGVVQQGARRGGLNENYGREIMELHTLGVDGGYTQKDVQEVARCFTGWSIDRQSGQFRFYPFRHDDGAKNVLGHFIPAGGGMQDGETVLDILASHPSTSRFIAKKLCVRFVSDTPPPALVERVAQTFWTTHGDLRAVMQTLVFSREFWAASSYRGKIKSPFEFAVSAVRAIDGHYDLPDPSDSMGRMRLVADGAVALGRGGRRGGRFRVSLIQQLGDMGEPLFSYEAPTGYPEKSQAWISAGGLLSRFNFGLALTHGQVAEVTGNPSALVDGVTASSHSDVIHRLAETIVGGDISRSTRKVLFDQMTSGDSPTIPNLEALLLGSPEFQKR